MVTSQYNNAFDFHNVGGGCKTLTKALHRYRTLIANNSRLVKTVYYNVSSCQETSDPNFLGSLTRLDVELTGDCDDGEFPSITMKEEYTLNVTAKGQKLASGTFWGILRGLETFSQLIYLTRDYNCHRVGTTSIHDYPRFPHRGLLLDTSRHYHTEEDILQLLDALSYNKFNVLHWHLTDDPSFPYVSTTFPKLSEKGAFHPTLMVYDQGFVQHVQDYGRERGIRVIAGFDTPGHALSWGQGNPDLLTKCYNLTSTEWGPIDPTKNSTYQFIFKFFDEVKSVFKDQYTHLGGDEVNFACWQSNPQIKQWMAENGMAGNYPRLQNYYMQKLINHVHSLHLRSIVWEEVFTNGASLPNSTVVHVWKPLAPAAVLSNVTAAGYPAIVSAYWSLGRLANGGDWLKFYNEDPLEFAGTEAQKKLVLGGEVSMWGEVVDGSNLESRVWPRASAVAEKFWSAAQAKLEGLDDALGPVAARLEEQTCRIKRRGIRAQPPTGPSACF